MSLFRFSKPKGPGFGISKDFYLSVLASKPTLPSIVQAVNPQGAGGAVEGYGAPLAHEATKDDLAKPLVRGVYAIATKDRKTVLRTVVVSKEEGGFDPEAFARSGLADSVGKELLARIRATWTMIQLSFESHHPMVYPALEFLLRLAKRLGELADGAIADPIAQRYLLPSELEVATTSTVPVRSQDHVAVHFRSKDGFLTAFTLGMRKFALPELEIQGLDEGLRTLSAVFLHGVCQGVLMGRPLSPGDTVGSPDAALQVAVGGFDRARWEGIPCLELLPPRSRTVSDALLAWQLEGVRE